MSLYANLLDTDSSASISRDPVLFKDANDDAPAKKSTDPGAPILCSMSGLCLTIVLALRFQPIRRPQLKAPTKPKPAFPKAGIPSTATATAAPTVTATTSTTVPVPGRSTLADWAATEEDEYLYYGAGEKRQRGGRRNKKKKKREADDNLRETDWDELYDPARPTNVEEYLRSGERVREVREWKAVLYAHRRQRGSEDGSGSEREEERESTYYLFVQVLGWWLWAEGDAD
jgi:splicing factor 45